MVKEIDAIFDYQNKDQLNCLSRMLDTQEFGENVFRLHYKTIPGPRVELLRDYYKGWRDGRVFKHFDEQKPVNMDGLKILDAGDEQINWGHVALIFPNLEGKIPHMIKARHFAEAAPRKGEKGAEDIVDAPRKKEYWKEKYPDMIMVITHRKEPSDSVRSRYHRIWTIYPEHMMRLTIDCKKCGTKEEKHQMRVNISSALWKKYQKDPDLNPEDYEKLNAGLRVLKCTNCKAEMPHPKWVYVGRDWENVDFSSEWGKAQVFTGEKLVTGAKEIRLDG